jgi:hypothetical protein
VYSLGSGSILIVSGDSSKTGNIVMNAGTSFVSKNSISAAVSLLAGASTISNGGSVFLDSVLTSINTATAQTSGSMAFASGRASSQSGDISLGGDTSFMNIKAGSAALQGGSIFSKVMANDIGVGGSSVFESAGISVEGRGNNVAFHTAATSVAGQSGSILIANTNQGPQGVSISSGKSTGESGSIQLSTGQAFAEKSGSIEMRAGRSSAVLKSKDTRDFSVSLFAGASRLSINNKFSDHTV